MREDHVTRPDGRPGVFGIVEMKAGSSVLALTAGGDALLVREFKYAVGRETLEVISGAIEERESPLDAARRELREEAGIEAREWMELGVLDPFTTAIQSPNYIFLARGLSETARTPDDGEFVQPVRVPFERALDMALSAEITHAASVVAILKAARLLSE